MIAYLEAAGLMLNDHRYRQSSTSRGHTPVGAHRPRHRSAKVFSRAIAAVRAWAGRRRLASELYARDDRLLADAGFTRADISAVVNGTYVRRPELAPIEYAAARQVPAGVGAPMAPANDRTDDHNRRIAA